MPQPLHQISWLEHIRCYPKSTLPHSKDCALAIPLTEYYSDHPASVPMLMLGLLAHHPLHCCLLYCCPWFCHNHCCICTTAPSASMLSLVLSPSTASALHLLSSCCIVHCNSVTDLPTDLPVGLETPTDAEAPSVADKCSLSDLYAATTTPCISHYCTPLCAFVH